MKKTVVLVMFILVDASLAFAQANQKLPRPFQAVGAQIGLNQIDSGGACVGEAGLKAVDTSCNAYVLSNNHVLGCNNGGGVEVDQPGLSLAACVGNSSCKFGTVHSYINLVPNYNYNETDAGLSTVTPTTGTADNIIFGFTKTISTVVQTAPVLNEAVGLINSQASVNGQSNLIVCYIQSTTAAPKIDYSCVAQNGGPVTPCCFDIPAGHLVGFFNQIAVQCPVPNSTFDGDSGAVIFSAYDSCNMPISIHYAGVTYGGGALLFSGPILLTLQNLGVSIAGSNACQSNPPNGPVIARSTLTPKFLLAQYSSSDMSDPGSTVTGAMPIVKNGPPLSSEDSAKNEMIGQAENSPSFEATRSQWEAALGMNIIYTGGFVEFPNSSLKFVIAVNAQGKPIPDVLPHEFMGVPVEVRDVPPIKLSSKVISIPAKNAKAE